MDYPRDQALIAGGADDDNSEIAGDDIPNGHPASIQAIKADKNSPHHAYLNRVIEASGQDIRDNAEKWRGSDVSTRKVFSNVLNLLGRYFSELDINRLEVSSKQPELTQRFFAHWRGDTSVADSSKIVYRATVISFFKEVLGVDIAPADLPAKRVYGSSVWKKGKKTAKKIASPRPMGFLDYPDERIRESPDFLKLELKGNKVDKMPSTREALHLAELMLYFSDADIAKENIHAATLTGNTDIATDFRETFGHAPAFLVSMRQLGVMNAGSFELTPNFITRLTASDELDRWTLAMEKRYERIRRITREDFDHPYLHMPNNTMPHHNPGDPVRFFQLHSQKMLKIKRQREADALELREEISSEIEAMGGNAATTQKTSVANAATPTVKKVAADALRAALEATAIACDIDQGKLRERLIRQGVMRQTAQGLVFVA